MSFSTLYKEFILCFEENKINRDREKINQSFKLRPKESEQDLADREQYENLRNSVTLHSSIEQEETEEIPQPAEPTPPKASLHKSG